jgi:DNA polymerase-3 subunit gamma/tau
MWATVREKVRERSRTTEVMLSGATVRAVDADTLVLMHESAPLAKRLSEQRNADVIREALRDALGVDWKVRCDTGTGAPVADQPVRRGGAPAQAPAPEAEDRRQAEAERRRAEEDRQRAEEERMMAEAAAEDVDPGPRRDPEEIALELLQNELGARKIGD